MSLSANAQEIFAQARKRSEDGLKRMRAEAAEVFSTDLPIIIGINGSYARREATSGSDVDIFFLYSGQHQSQALDYQRSFRERLEKAGFELPAVGGVFSEPLSVSVTREMIGGLDDNNTQITRRMLLLLEGEWIFNEAGFDDARRQLLKKYVPDSLRDDQICLFLLNDVIRYWRTICVDFEFKVQVDGKPRAIRLIKLRFSRMLLFLAGVLAIGTTQGKTVNEKLSSLADLLAIPTIERVQKIAGDHANKPLELYAEFLQSLDNKSTRAALSQSSPKGEDSTAFEDLRAKAHAFRDALITLLYAHYGKDNPTIAALLL